MSLTAGESYKENFIETLPGGKKGKGNSEDRSLNEMTTESNQEDMIYGEYIETIENTPSTSSIIHMKTEDINQDNLLLSAQCLLSQNVSADEASNFSKGYRNISEAHKKS